MMDSSVSGKAITFQTGHSGYYVLAEKISEGRNPQSPQTGDTGNLRLWGAVPLLACGGLVGIALVGRKKKQDAD